MDKFADWQISTGIDHQVTNEAVEAILELLPEIKQRVPYEINPLNIDLPNRFQLIKDKGLKVKTTYVSDVINLWQREGRQDLPIAFLNFENDEPSLFFTEQLKSGIHAFAIENLGYEAVIKYLFLHEIFELVMLELGHNVKPKAGSVEHTKAVDDFWLKYFGSEYQWLSSFLV